MRRYSITYGPNGIVRSGLLLVFLSNIRFIKALYQSALNQLYILTSTGAPSLPDQGPVVNKIAMARTFWYAHVHEGMVSLLVHCSYAVILSP
jgi:hypothetical protein